MTALVPAPAPAVGGEPVAGAGVAGAGVAATAVGGVTGRVTVSPARFRARLVARVAAYVALTKPRIIELLLVTTVPTMMLAAGGFPPLSLVAATLVGGALAAGSANALNCYVDRDIDAVMRRTGRRPLARRTIAPRNALIFGLVLGVLATVELALTTNALSAGLAVGAIAFYVLVYTLGLKRRTPSNIVWGGAAGCMPVLIGWSAVTGTLAVAPLVLFAVIFFWTPPHFWALAIRFRDDYAAAGVPMLPVRAAPVLVTRRMAAYSWLMVAASVLLWPLATTAFYGVAALLLGAGFLRSVLRLHARARAEAGAGEPEFSLVRPAALPVFHQSITYLTLLFAALSIDTLLPS